MEKNAIVVTVCGAKGGTGKTSTSANMGGILADLGKQVCLIDMAPIDHISLYDRNPRREKNPRYAEIRASLLANGLQEILNVTQRPDARPEHYMIARGGNTVLQICKEIYQQSRDKRFHIIRCNYVAWMSESDALIGHIIENNARGDIRFIDSALATLQMKKLLTEEGGGPLSEARFIKTLQDKGHALSKQNYYGIEGACLQFLKSGPLQKLKNSSSSLLKKTTTEICTDPNPDNN